VDECQPLPDGEWLASTCLDETFSVWDTNTWHEFIKVEGRAGEYCSPRPFIDTHFDFVT